MLIAPEWVKNEAVHKLVQFPLYLKGGRSVRDDEYDQKFVNDFPGIQVSPWYNQTQTYRGELFDSSSEGERASIFSWAGTSQALWEHR